MSHTQQSRNSQGPLVNYGGIKNGCSKVKIMEPFWLI